jgi:hypothetical protein
LINRLIREYSAHDAIYLETVKEKPLRVGEYSKISKDDFAEWKRYLQIAAKRKNCGGCLLLLDGDSAAKIEKQPFCAMRAGRLLAEEAKKVGAGKMFSTAIVFACMEFESWMIPSANAFVNADFSNQRKEITELVKDIPDIPERSPRNAKGWFREIMHSGYKPTRDQADLAKLADINQIRSANMRSFQRLESAIEEIIKAFREGQHIVSPII